MDDQEIFQDVPAHDSEHKPQRYNINNKVLLISNIVLLALVIVLYVLFYLHKSEQKNEFKIPAAASYYKPGGLKVGFINSDTLKAHYDLVKDLQKELEKKYSHFDNDISSRQKTLEAKAKDLQDRYEKKLISMEDAQKADEQLKMESKKLYDLNQEYTGKMGDEESKMNQVFIDSIHNFLKRFNSRMEFDYVLGYSKGGGILFARDTLDITKEVLDALNAEYKRNKPAK